MKARKLKSEFIIGGAIPFTILYFSHEVLQVFLMNCGSIFSLNNFLLVFFLYGSLKPLSCTVLIKLFDCLEDYIQNPNWRTVIKRILSLVCIKKLSLMKVRTDS